MIEIYEYKFIRKDENGSKIISMIVPNTTEVCRFSPLSTECLLIQYENYHGIIWKAY